MDRSMWRFAMTWSNESSVSPIICRSAKHNSPSTHPLNSSGALSKCVMMVVCSAYMHNQTHLDWFQHMGQLSLLPCGCQVNSEAYKKGLHHVNPPGIHHSSQTRTNQPGDQPIQQTTKPTW